MNDKTHLVVYSYNRAAVSPVRVIYYACYYCTWTDIFVRVSGGETPPFRPPIPSNDTTNDPQLIQLMRDCWDEYPTLRPDFSAIRSRLLLINGGKYDTVCIAIKLTYARG